MLLFCPSCSNVLTVTSKPTLPFTNAPNEPLLPPTNHLECQTCPYQYALTKRVYERKVYVRREREDVFGGPGEWDNAQKTAMQCTKPGCNGDEAAFMQIQIRSADEPMTSFLKCMTCGHRWREN